MSDYMEILRPQVERVKAMVDGPDLDPNDKALLRKCGAASIDAAERRKEITKQQRDELMKLLYPFEVEIFPEKRE
jgi:hypothetical protein